MVCKIQLEVAYYKEIYILLEMDTIWKINQIDSWLKSDHKKLPEKKIFMNDLPSETWHGLKYIDFGLMVIYTYLLECHVIYTLNLKQKIQDLPLFISMLMESS